MNAWHCSLDEDGKIYQQSTLNRNDYPKEWTGTSWTTDYWTGDRLFNATSIISPKDAWLKAREEWNKGHQNGSPHDVVK